MEVLNLILSALSQGAIYAPMAIGVFIAFRILNTPDLTIDGSLVFGMTTCAMITIAGHPILAIFIGMLAGAGAGLITGLLQTKLKINPILSGILTMTGLYTINYMILGGQSNRYLQYETTNSVGVTVAKASDTIYKMFDRKLEGIFEDSNSVVLTLTAIIVVIVVVALCLFFKTRSGMAIRATGDNEEMVRSSSINADTTRIIGIMVANGLVALSGSLLCHQQRYVDLNNGSGMLVVGLASVIIGQAFFGKRGVTIGVISAVFGSALYRIILQIAYKIDMPSYSVKLLSALIVVVALSLPLIKEKIMKQKIKKASIGGAI